MVEVFDEALARVSRRSDDTAPRAEALLSAGKAGPARAAMDDYAARFPDDPNTEYLRARLELSDGDARAAAQRLERLVPRLDRAWTQHWLGRALEAAGDRAGADRRYQLALQREPHNAALYGRPIAMAERRSDWRSSAGLARQLVTVVQGVYTDGRRSRAASCGGSRGGGGERWRAAPWPCSPTARRRSCSIVRALRANGEYDAALSVLGELGADGERLPTARRSAS